MAIAKTLKSYLDRHNVPYDMVHHAHTHSALIRHFLPMYRCISWPRPW